MEASLPAGGTLPDLSSVSCAAPGDCSAVGYYVDSSGSGQGLLLTETSGTWQTGIQAPLPANAISGPNGEDAGLSSVSCAAPGDCSAVGFYTDSSGSQMGLLLTETSGTWATGVEAALPANAESGSDQPGAWLSSVSCAAPGDCSAVGSYINEAQDSYSSQGLLLTETSGTWQTGIQAPLPANAETTPGVELSSVSCASAGDCSAVGYYVDSSASEPGLLLTETSGTWQTGIQAPLPANADTTQGVDLSSVSCASAGDCSAVGSYYDSVGSEPGLLLTETSGTWQTGIQVPLPANANTTPMVDLSSVSCASAGDCSAVGSYYDSVGSEPGLLLTETSGTWQTGIQAPLPANANTTPMVDLSSVSCASAGDCSAVGSYNDSVGSEPGLLLTETSGTWQTGIQAPLPANANTSLSAGLTSVSCVTADNCAAVGSSAPSSGDEQGLLLSTAMPTPTITSVGPRAGPIAGGTSVVVTGSGFGSPGDADTVTFVPEGGGAPIHVVNPTVVSETEIELTTPDVSAVYDGDVLHTNVQVTDTDGSTSTIGPSGQFNFPATVVEMGDSIAAGEGTLDGFFYSPANGETGLWSGGVANAPGFGPYPECHDSGYAYGQLLSAALRTNFVTLACTGASYAEGIVGPEVFKNHLSANVTVPAQFPSSTYEKAQPDAVVMTYGADDVQFSSIAKLCIASALASSPRTKSIVAEAALAADAGPEQCTQSNPGSTVDTDFTEYLPQLKESYAKTVSAIESRGKAASPPRVPKIIITNYMDPFPPNGVGCADTWPLDNAQLAYFNTLFTALNSTIRSAVIRLNNPNVSFVDISKALEGHTWCTPAPWDYGLSVNLQSGILNFGSDAPFHPTPAGQAAIAKVVQPVVAAALGLTETGATVTSASPDGGGSADGVTAEPGESISAEASGFAPDETVEETLHSTPVSLGTVMANGNGAISATVTVPLGTAAGQHELRFTGQTSGATATLPVLIPTPPTGPVFTADSPPQTVPSGSVYAGYIAASGVPTPTYTMAPGSPAWLSIEPSFSGIVSGTPPSGTTSFTYSVIASNGVDPNATAGPFTVTVTAGSESLAGRGSLAGSGLTGVLGAKGEAKAPATGSTSLDGSTISVQRNHEALIKLTCTGTATCSGRLTLMVKRTTGKGKKRHTKTQTIGTATFSIAAGKSETVKLTLNGTGRAVLSAAHGHLSATLTILKASPSPSNTQTHGVHLAQQKTKAKQSKK